MSDRALRLAVAAVAAAGVAVAGYLTYVHFQPDALICTGGGGCEAVQDSSYAEIAGIPVALLGLLAYLAVLVLVGWDSELARTLAATIALSAAGFAVYLVVVQAFVIDAWCVWCLVNDLVIVPLLVVLTVWRVLRPADGRGGEVGQEVRREGAEGLRQREPAGQAAPARSSGPGGGCSTRCGRGSPSGCRPWR